MTGANTKVTPGGDIRPHNLPAPIAEHRADYWTWVDNHVDTDMRDTLLAFRDHWQECNRRFFDGRTHLPYIALTESSAPAIYGQCCSQSSWGSRLEIRLRPSLLDGMHPCMNGSRQGRVQFVKDVLLHEMIHQHIGEHQPSVNESSYHGHGPIFTEHCNLIGALLGLPEVVVRNRKGKPKRPKSAQWPHCVVPPERYLGAHQPHSAQCVTTSSVYIPIDYTPSAIGPADEMPFLNIDFDTDSGDKPTMCVSIHVDTAWQLADFIFEYLNGDDDDNDDLQ